jgi:anthranilate synthase component 2
MRLLVLDNYDSFTYNLVHLVEKVSDFDFDVIKNDQLTVEDAKAYDKILFSPGPGLPAEAGIMPDLIRKYAGSKSIFGVCLGHQAIAEAFGANLKNLDRVYHGLSLPVNVTGDDNLFSGCNSSFNAGRYHSWVVDHEKFPDALEVTAIDDEGLIMALKHTSLDVRGVQFHPESVLSEHGELILSNWLNY